jgi:uncharacterized protein YjbI with pentapeptide repeats
VSNGDEEELRGQADPADKSDLKVAAKLVNETNLLPGWAWWLVVLAIVVVLALLFYVMLWGPAYLVNQGKASDDAYLRAITDTRTTLVQAVGGLAVFLGVVIGLITLLHNRQAMQQTLAFNRESMQRTMAVTERGQITDRFSKAIEQLGQSADNAIDLRLGGIYALEQIARDSADWHKPVVEVLAAFVRLHASGHHLPEGDTVDAQRAALASMTFDERFVPLRVDIAAAINVLARRDRTKDARGRLDFHKVDFRRVDFPVILNLERTNFAHAQMQHSYLGTVNFRGCSFLGTMLQGAFLMECDLRDAILFAANLDGADLAHARLDGADLSNVDLSRVLNLTIDQLKVAKTDETTVLPSYIDRGALAAAVGPAEPA